MRAITWHGKEDMRCEQVPDPVIESPRDAIVKVTSCAICGSDLHFYDGYMPGMKKGDIVGHEFMGEVVEVGRDNSKLSVGDRVIVPFTIVCGECDQCRRQNFSCCERSNRNRHLADVAFGHSTAGMFGYSHITGGYAGGQAEYVRVPYADVAPVKIPDGLTDDQVLFLGDILPTGWQAAAQCDIQPSDTVAIWGAGPVGQFAAKAAQLMGAKQVIVIDNVPERLEMAETNGSITLNFDNESVLERLSELTDGKGPEKCVIDAVGMESHGFNPENFYDRAKQALMLEQDRPSALRHAIMACRKGGRVSVPGVYGGYVDKFPLGAIMEKGLTLRTGQTHVQKYLPMLLDLVREGKLDTTFLISHRMSLEDAAEGYRKFSREQDTTTKVVLKTAAAKGFSGAASA